MKKVIVVMIVLLSLVASIFGIRIIANNIVINNYNKGIYNEKNLKLLYFLNITEPYIVYYNNGNMLYKLEKYDDAISKYNEALEHNPSKDRICDIRINISLSMLANIKNNLSKEEKLKALKEARKELYENGCANEDDDEGLSTEAEKLEEEIKKMEEATENGGDSEDPGESGDPNNGNGGNTSDPNPDEVTTIEIMINEANSGANSGRDDELTNDAGHGDYSYNGKTW